MNRRSIMTAVVLAVLAAGSASAAPAAPQQPGSYLIFPRFDIRTGAVTHLRITNTHDSQDIGVKLNYVCPGVFLGDQRCKATERTLILTPRETRVVDVKEHSPQCKQGFAAAAAAAVDRQTHVVGSPVAFDYLIGSWHIAKNRKFESENAIATQSRLIEGSRLAPVALVSAEDYRAFGSELHTEFRAANASLGSGSWLTLLTLDTLAGRQNPSTSTYLDYWNAVEVPFSSSHEFVCWDSRLLEDIDPNFEAEALGTAFGSLTLGAVPNCPMPGGCPPLAWYEPVLLGAITEFTASGSSTRNLIGGAVLPENLLSNPGFENFTGPFNTNGDGATTSASTWNQWFGFQRFQSVLGSSADVGADANGSCGAGALSGADFPAGWSGSNFAQNNPDWTNSCDQRDKLLQGVDGAGLNGQELALRFRYINDNPQTQPLLYWVCGLNGSQTLPLFFAGSGCGKSAGAATIASGSIPESSSWQPFSTTFTVGSDYAAVVVVFELGGRVFPLPGIAAGVDDVFLGLAD